MRQCINTILLVSEIDKPLYLLHIGEQVPLKEVGSVRVCGPTVQGAGANHKVMPPAFAIYGACGGGLFPYNRKKLVGSLC